ncbi:MAG TPA: hypothetical protein VHX36_04965 [Candidatus Acidoferrales bacterium]|nr:hypothetical protein [Candidatus Acidoferrales bacterium]
MSIQLYRRNRETTTETKAQKLIELLGVSLSEGLGNLVRQRKIEFGPSARLGNAAYYPLVARLSSRKLIATVAGDPSLSRDAQAVSGYQSDSGIYVGVLTELCAKFHSVANSLVFFDIVVDGIFGFDGYSVESVKGLGK